MKCGLSTDLVKIKHQVQLAHIAEERIENLDEKVDGLEICKLVVVGVDADTEEQTGVASVDNLHGTELDEIGLVLLVAGRYQPVHLALDPDLLLVAVRRVPFGEPGLALAVLYQDE